MHKSYVPPHLRNGGSPIIANPWPPPRNSTPPRNPPRNQVRQRVTIVSTPKPRFTHIPSPSPPPRNNNVRNANVTPPSTVHYPITTTHSTSNVTSKIKKSSIQNRKIARRRLGRDLAQLQRSNIASIAAHPITDDIFEWHVNIRPIAGVYSGVYFHLIITFPETYPSNPPTIHICTPVVHPNISDNTLCLSMLTPATHHTPYQGWSSAYSVMSILMQLQSFLFAEKIEHKSGLKINAKLSYSDVSKSKAICTNFVCEKCHHSHAMPWPYIKGSKQSLIKMCVTETHNAHKIMIQGTDVQTVHTSWVGVRAEFGIQCLTPKSAGKKDAKIQNIPVQNYLQNTSKNTFISVATTNLRKPRRKPKESPKKIAAIKAKKVAVKKQKKVLKIAKKNPKIMYEALVSWTGDEWSENNTRGGLCRFGFGSNAVKICGSDKESFGYGGSAMYSYDGKYEEFGEKFAKGDTVTVGIDLENFRIFFALNGKLVEREKKLFIPEHLRSKKLFPALAFKNARVDFNFGSLKQKCDFLIQNGFKTLEQMFSYTNKSVTVHSNVGRDSECKSAETISVCNYWSSHYITPALWVYIFEGLLFEEIFAVQFVCQKWYDLVHEYNVTERHECQCYFSKVKLADKDWMSDESENKEILGIGLSVRSSNIEGHGIAIHSQWDILSLNAWNNGCKSGVWGEELSHFLPLILDKKHAMLAEISIKHHLQLLTDIFCVIHRSHSNELEKCINTTNCLKLVDTVADMMNLIVVQFVMGDKNRTMCEKVVLGYCSLHHLLLYLVSQNEETVSEFANKCVSVFINDRHGGDKKNRRDLGKLLIYLIISKYEWHDIAHIFMKEAITRNVLWMVTNEKYTKYDTTDVVSERLKNTFDASVVSHRLTMFQVWFMQNNETETLHGYNQRFGRPNVTVQNAIVKQTKKFLSIQTWKAYLKELGVIMNESKDIDQLLRFAVYNSDQKGYHRPNQRELVTFINAPKITITVENDNSIRNYIYNISIKPKEPQKYENEILSENGQFETIEKAISNAERNEEFSESKTDLFNDESRNIFNAIQKQPSMIIRQPSMEMQDWEEEQNFEQKRTYVAKKTYVKRKKIMQRPTQNPKQSRARAGVSDSWVDMDQTVGNAWPIQRQSQNNHGWPIQRQPMQSRPINQKRHTNNPWEMERNFEEKWTRQPMWNNNYRPQMQRQYSEPQMQPRPMPSRPQIQRNNSVVELPKMSKAQRRKTRRKNFISRNGHKSNKNMNINGGNKENVNANRKVFLRSGLNNNSNQSPRTNTRNNNTIRRNNNISERRNVVCVRGKACTFWQNGYCWYKHNAKDMECAHCGGIGHSKSRCGKLRSRGRPRRNGRINRY